MRSIHCCIAVIGFIGLSAGAGLLCAQIASGGSVSAAAPVVSAPQQQSAGGISDDRTKISPEDTLHIDVFDVPELSRDYRVAPDGTIRIQLLQAPIVAAGETPISLANRLADEFTKNNLLRSPQVVVEIEASRTHVVTVSGAVKMPQTFQVFGKMPLLNAISQAGGLADNASQVALITRAGNDSGPVRVDLKTLMKGDQAQNVDLYPGDSVMVQQAGVIYVIGAVNRAGGFVLDGGNENLSVISAIALAGDIKSTAAQRKTVIIRKTAAGNGTNQEVPVDLKKVLANKEPDPTLMAGDILFVPDSAMLKAIYRSGEALTQAATVIAYGSVIYK